MKKIDVFLGGVLAGISISIGATAYLVNPFIGCILFSFGLIAVVQNKWQLYTGAVGAAKFSDKDYWINLGIMLCGNIIGATFIASIVSIKGATVISPATDIVISRLEYGWMKCFSLSILCGFIVDMGANSARKDSIRFDKYLPLLFGVPLFVLCGFPHSIADIVYIMLCDSEVVFENIGAIIGIWCSIVVGNAVGSWLKYLVKQ